MKIFLEENDKGKKELREELRSSETISRSNRKPGGVMMLPEPYSMSSMTM